MSLVAAEAAFSLDQPSTALVICDDAHYFAVCSEIRVLAERIERVEDAKSLADKAAAAKVWAQRAHLGEEQINLAAIAKLWAERRAGELLILSRENGERVGFDGAAESSNKARLDDLGLTKHESSRFQKLAAVPADDFEQAIDDAAAEGQVTTAGVLRKMDVHYSSKTPEWSTPQDLFDSLNAEFSFGLDVCATSKNAKCEHFFSPEQDGLTQAWHGYSGAIWMNPPYGDEIAKWVAKAHQAFSEWGETVVCLLPARTDTAWFWNYCGDGEVRFLRGRLKFGGSVNSAPFPSAVVIFGPKHPPHMHLWER